MVIDPLLILMSKIVIAALFMQAGIHKLLDIKAFRQVLMNYGVSGFLLAPSALLIIAVELLLSIGILIYGNLMMIAASGLLGFYSVLLIFNLLARRAIDCGCNFGNSNEPIGGWHILRNLILLSISALHLVPVTGRELIWLDYTTAIFASVLFGLLLVTIEHLNVNHHYFNRIRNAS